MLPNEVFALECIARYAKEGLVVDSNNGEFAHCPTPRPKGQRGKLAGDLGYYLTFNDHQKQGLLQSVDVGRRCYWIQAVYRYLNTMPPGHEELRVIYDEFNKHTEKAKKKMSEARSGKTHTEETKKKMSKSHSGEKASQYGKFGALHPNSKAIIVIEPDGTKLHFGGVHEAARDLIIPRSNLYYYLKVGYVTGGKFGGYQFFYAVKE